MATWSELKSFVKSNYKVAHESDGALMLGFNTVDDRSQVIMVIHVEQDFAPDFVTFASTVAKVGSVPAEKVMAEARIFGVGVFDDEYVVKDIVFLDDLDPSEVNSQFNLVAMAADLMEARLTGGGDQH